MHNAIPLILAAFIAVAIIATGCFYLVSRDGILGTSGLKMLYPADAVAGFEIPVYTMSVIMHFAHREFERKRR